MLGPREHWIDRARRWRRAGKLVNPRTNAIEFIHNYAWWSAPGDENALRKGWD